MRSMGTAEPRPVAPHASVARPPAAPSVSAQGVAARLAAVVGGANVVTDEAELLVYEADGLTHGRVRPELVVLPGSTEEVAAVARIAHAREREHGAARHRPRAA